VVANPRAGSQEAARFTKTYGTQIPYQYNVPKSTKGGFFDCRATVFDITTQKKNILEEIETNLMSKLGISF
jgi:uncharacterized membrane protein YvbJ